MNGDITLEARWHGNSVQMRP